MALSDERKYWAYQKDKSCYIALKRVMDIILCVLGIVAFLPLFAITALAVKLDDINAPVFYGHVRVGRGGRKFKCWKFRTMYANADEIFERFTPEQKKEFEKSFKLKVDPRVTRLGDFLRRTSIDELPQILNVFAGDMSIVGPRPVVEEELKKYGDKRKVYKSVKPGITGIWQVSGRSDTTYEERVMMDVDYVNNMGLVLDLKIICLTVARVLRRDGAY